MDVEDSERRALFISFLSPKQRTDASRAARAVSSTVGVLVEGNTLPIDGFSEEDNSELGRAFVQR